jgi:hypothetical protein
MTRMVGGGGGFSWFYIQWHHDTHAYTIIYESEVQHWNVNQNRRTKFYFLYVWGV